MSPDAAKNAHCLHAKDDHPEVRREVFRLLPVFRSEVHVAIRRKDCMIAQASNLIRDHGRKMTEGMIYDALVKTLFANLLHKAEENHVTFARRGKANRQAALQRALDHAKARFERKWRKGIDRPVSVATDVPSRSTRLQIVDYYLWALQRLFERKEDRFYELLADQYRLIIDIDDRHRRKSGRWYSASNDQLSLEKITPVAG